MRNEDVRDQLIESLEASLIHTRYLEEEGTGYEKNLFAGIAAGIGALLKLLEVPEEVAETAVPDSTVDEVTPELGESEEVTEDEITTEEITTEDATTDVESSEAAPDVAVAQVECVLDRKDITSRVVPDPGDGLPSQRIASETLTGPHGTELKKEVVTFLGKLDWSFDRLEARDDAYVVTTWSVYTDSEGKETTFELRNYRNEEDLSDHSGLTVPLFGDAGYWTEDSGLWAVVVTSGNPEQLKFMDEIDMVRGNQTDAMRLFYRVGRVFSMKILCGDHVEATFPEKR